MATARGTKYRPVKVVEFSAPARKIAPSSPKSSPPSSPKKVQFASKATSSRELTSPEAWSLYHFECHARGCPACYEPLGVYLKGAQLCDAGHALAQDVAIHVYYKAGEIYSQDTYKLVRVELPPGYDQVRGLLKGMDHRLRQTSQPPMISYDRSYPVSPRQPSRRPEYEERNEVIIEPADSRPSKGSGRKSKHKSSKHKTTVIQDTKPEVEPELSTSQESKPRERRGSLYVSDQARRERKYNTETREPQWERSKKDERRKSGFFS